MKTAEVLYWPLWHTLQVPLGVQKLMFFQTAVIDTNMVLPGYLPSGVDFCITALEVKPSTKKAWNGFRKARVKMCLGSYLYCDVLATECQRVHGPRLRGFSFEPGIVKIDNHRSFGVSVEWPTPNEVVHDITVHLHGYLMRHA